VEHSLSIYDFPGVYDRVLQVPHAQIETEVRSIRQLLARREVTSGRILELACGACAHGIPLAREGFSVTGIDLSQTMLDRARERAEQAGVALELVCGDIVDFDLDTAPFDCAIFMFETFPLLTTYDEIASHFRCVRRHLRPGGVYVVDVDAHKHGVGTEHQTWGQRTVSLDDGWVEVWNEDLPGDWVRGTRHMVLRCRIHLQDQVYETADEWQIRMDSPWNLAVLARTLEGWSLDSFYSWRDLSPDIAPEEHYWMVLETDGRDAR
jgi:SAM-dependent methyltransferase